MATTKTKDADDKTAAEEAAAKPFGDETAGTFEVPTPEPGDYEVGPGEVVAPFEGGWVKLKAGDYLGRVGYWVETLETDDDGLPTKILVRTRDAENMLVPVDYADVERPVDYFGGR